MERKEAIKRYEEVVEELRESIKIRCEEQEEIILKELQIYKRILTLLTEEEPCQIK